MGLLRRPKAFLVFWLVPLVQAYTVFETNCSTPATLSNYVSSPNTRGTLDILWSSLFTIFACTWTLQHPNVPEQREDRDPGLLGDIKWGLKGFYRSTIRMAWTVIAPEVVIAAALEDFTCAHGDSYDMRNQVDSGKGSWSLTHSFYANMGAFVIRGRVKPRGKPRYHDPYHLTSKGIFALIEGGYIDKLPDMTEEEIKDKSKGDLFAKMIAVGQIVWSIIQIIGRAARRLPVSPLEVAVVAFAVCAVMIHGLYWHKPQRVGSTTTIHLKETCLTEDGAIPEAVLEALKDSQKIERVFGEFLLRGPPLPGSSISLDSSSGGVEEPFVVMPGAVVFGAIHAAAWNFAFPSRTELIFWRCASLYTAIVPLCIMMMAVFKYELTSQRKVKESTGNVVLGYAVIITAFLYIVARLFILVEMFRTLCFLPPDSYVSTWASNIPHVA